MIEYNQSKNKELKKNLQRTHEMNFFLFQYRKRKFLTDKNVLFNETDADDAKKEKIRFFQCDKMTYEDVNSLYSKLVDMIIKSKNTEAVKGEFFNTLINFNLTSCTQNVIDFLNSKEINEIHIKQDIEQTINELQFYFAIDPLHLFQDEVIRAIKSPEICKKLLSDHEIYYLIYKLTVISLRYGILATALCSPLTDIEVKNSVDANESTINIMFLCDNDFNKDINKNIYITSKNIKDRHYLNTFNKLASGQKLVKQDLGVFNRVISDYDYGSYNLKSVLIRRAGLWLWDHCNNQIKKDNMKIEQAIKQLSNYDILIQRKNEDLLRILTRTYYATKRCITNGALLPIK